jgi:hypothetical protein
MVRVAGWSLLLMSACASGPQPVAPAVEDARGTMRADQLQMRDPDRVSRSAGPVIEPLRPVPVRLDAATAEQARTAKRSTTAE